ncbi:hypothetical protein B0H16DRAFT_1736969 [Mycena metata]|uniref:Secreted protein n=1 Tax=Mycena metata TaxID=1033252 RepID=A0AAD7HNL1_9AGAR|nr:hypothetical protein B0H16DRAFT_1736969 [Mycena metata]
MAWHWIASLLMRLPRLLFPQPPSCRRPLPGECVEMVSDHSADEGGLPHGLSMGRFPVVRGCTPFPDHRQPASKLKMTSKALATRLSG